MKQECFSQADERNGEAMGTPFYKGITNASDERFVSNQVELGAELPSKAWNESHECSKGSLLLRMNTNPM